MGDSRGKEISTIDVPLNESPQAVEIIEAAAGGNLQDMHRFAGNPDLFCCDYDSRTALHLAASNGHLGIVKYILPNVCVRLYALVEGGHLLFHCLLTLATQVFTREDGTLGVHEGHLAGFPGQGGQG